MRTRATFCLVLLLLAGCDTFDPKPIDSVPFKPRLQIQEKDGITVSTTVLSAEESKRVFGLNLEKTKVQAVWIRVDNRTDVPYNLMHHGVDPNYFSAAEVAYMHRPALGFGRNDRIDEHVERLSFQESIPANASGEGFVFSNLKVGIKEVEIKLYGPARAETFEFYVSVPGSRADHYSVDWAALRDQIFDDLEDELAFRDALRALPCCTTRADGRGRGDPVNLVLIGSAGGVFRAMIRAGWDQTEKLTAASAWRSAKAFFGGEYKHSPMSALYLFGRAQDVGFQKARSSIHQRNHLRLWLSPLRYRGEEVWVGTITRDIGVYFTTRAWNLMTHAIDPDVDEARRYLLEDLALGGFIDLWGPVRGVGAATREAPHRNLMNAPWWTDGNRLVMSIVEGPVPLEQHRYLFWDWPVPPGVDLDAFNQSLRELVDEHRGKR